MRNYTTQDIEALTNWDGLLCKQPWRNEQEKRQYYSRYINRMLWRSFSDNDWEEIASFVTHLRISDKLKRTTQFLIKRHIRKTEK